MEYLKACDVSFRPGGVFLMEAQQNILDADTRSCLLRTIRDPEIFTICDVILKGLTDGDRLHKFSMFKNDVTQIVYETGGKFLQHRDYLSVTSNVLEEYTLVVNVNEPGGEQVEGGETRVKINAATELVSKASTTPGGALLSQGPAAPESCGNQGEKGGHQHQRLVHAQSLGGRSNRLGHVFA
jgi:hypothetical protein